MVLQGTFIYWKTVDGDISGVIGDGSSAIPCGQGNTRWILTFWFMGDAISESSIREMHHLLLRLKSVH